MWEEDTPVEELLGVLYGMARQKVGQILIGEPARARGGNVLVQ
jgi:hypothetical protein